VGGFRRARHALKHDLVWVVRVPTIAVDQDDGGLGTDHLRQNAGVTGVESGERHLRGQRIDTTA
jgi:hypothetical protein